MTLNFETKTMTYTGWLLLEADRTKLLELFPPTYHDVIAHHVTLRMGISDLPTMTEGMIVGIVDDGNGVQALVVQIDGTVNRPDGHIYHITWSVDRDTHHRKPFHSLSVLREIGWSVVWPIPVTLVPQAFEVVKSVPVSDVREDGEPDHIA